MILKDRMKDGCYVMVVTEGIVAVMIVTEKMVAMGW